MDVYVEALLSVFGPLRWCGGYFLKSGLILPPELQHLFGFRIRKMLYI